MLALGEPLFLHPVFHEKIWGGTNLRTVFDYEIPSEKTGECWAISGHPHGVTTISNGHFAGYPLDKLWKSHSELFGQKDTTKPFPLLTKILDAHEDLSVQVHPDDNYAAIHEHELGKTECWYVIKADKDSELYFGHNATNKDELSNWIHAGEWSKLFRKIPVKAGDFFYVPSGTVHALGKGIMVLETQQSSDSTYRLYDFDRIDAKTHKKRELHIDKSIDTITVPHHDPQLSIKSQNRENCRIITFIKSPYFSVYQWKINGKSAQFYQNSCDFTLASVISGTGSLLIDDESFPIEKGDHFILPSTVQTWRFVGKDLSIIASMPGPMVK